MSNEILYPNIQFVPASGKTLNLILDQIDAFNRKLGNERINIRPDYQRGEAWDNDFKEKLIYSLVVNYPIGNFIMRRLKANSMEEPTLEVVDGQQRLIAIMEFVRKHTTLSPSISRQIIGENARYYEYDEKNNINKEGCKQYSKFLKDPKISIRLSFGQLPSLIQQQILNYNLNVIEVSCDYKAIRQYFRFVQNQERLRAGEIINAIPDSPLSFYLDKIINKDKFLEIIGWKESRKEFEKLFYSMAGIFDNKINFGTTDKSIIDYVSSFQSLSNESQEAMEKMISSINAVTEYADLNKYKFSKRLVKFFMLSSGYGFIDFCINTKETFDTFCCIESKLPCFNSGDKGEIAKTFDLYPNEMIDNYNKLFILGRGSHSPKSTHDILYCIVDIIKFEQNKK